MAQYRVWRVKYQSVVGRAEAPFFKSRDSRVAEMLAEIPGVVVEEMTLTGSSGGWVPKNNPTERPSILGRRNRKV